MVPTDASTSVRQPTRLKTARTRPRYHRFVSAVRVAHLILYVSDQARSAAFYRDVFGQPPRLDVPGMTEFQLTDSAILGLMPVAGIRRLLPQLADPARADGVARAELYVHVDDPAAALRSAVAAGAAEVSPVQPRDWGDVAGYCTDPDGHVVAFAAPAPAPGR